MRTRRHPIMKQHLIPGTLRPCRFVWERCALPEIPMTSTAVGSGVSSYFTHVNPQWVGLLDLLEMNVEYEHCLGCELFTSDGRRILDFLSGYCVHNTGHNHPAVIAALRDEMECLCHAI